MNDHRRQAEAAWQKTWIRLADRGLCDVAGGLEYHRVLRLWHAAGRPAAIAAYIRRVANRQPYLPGLGP